MSVLVCLAEAVPGLIYLWLRLRFSACSHVDYMALLFQKTLLVADLNFLLTQTHPTLCVCVWQPVTFFFVVLFYKVCFLHPFPESQLSAANHTTPQCTSASPRPCPAMTCLALVCLGLAAVWSWSEEEIDEEREGDKLNLMYAVIKCRLGKRTLNTAQAVIIT